MRLSPDRTPGHGKAASGGTTESDAFLQSRLVLLHKLLFFLSGGILLASVLVLGVLYSWAMVGESFAMAHRWMHAGLVLFFGGVWLVGSRFRLRGPTLVALDALGLLLTSLALALMIANADTGRGGAMELVAAMMLILAARAVVIPSSGRQTLVLSAVAVGLCTAAFTIKGVYWPATARVAHLSLRDSAITMAMWLSLMVATAAVASRVIFGLRREIHVARQVGQYELLDKIGEGGMGAVYRARHALLRRDTAIKLLPRANISPERLARFEREVRQTARLTHPNTVAIFDYGRTPEGVFYYAMEYLDGVDLEQLVCHGGPLPVSRAVHILRQVLLSLTEAHDMGLIHRDIKPANVILTERGGEADVAKVVDFGLVRDLRGVEAGLSGARGLAGTPLYLAPEVIRSPEEAGPASDLYAVAALGYYLVTGTHVFRGETIVEICAQHLHTAPEPPSVRLGRPLPEGLERLILTGLAKEAGQRFSTARMFREALESCPEIPRWTAEDARAWWTKHGEEIRARRKNAAVDERGRTVAVDLGLRGDPG